MEGLSLGKITLRVLFGDSTAGATRISPSKTVEKSLCSLFLQQCHQRFIIIVTFFKCSISNRSSSKFFAERHVCIASEVLYETRAAIG